MNEIINKFVRVIIEDDFDRVLMVSQRINNSLIWNFPGGKIEPLESPHVAAIREVYEETGIAILELDYICEDIFKFNDMVWRGYFYKGYADNFKVKNKEPEKLKSVDFYEWETLNNKKVFSAEIYNQIAKIKFGSNDSQLRLNLWAPSENHLNHFA